MGKLLTPGHLRAEHGGMANPRNPLKYGVEKRVDPLKVVNDLNSMEAHTRATDFRTLGWCPDIFACFSDEQIHTARTGIIVYGRRAGWTTEEIRDVLLSCGLPLDRAIAGARQP
jgi:hypothetical protein